MKHLLACIAPAALALAPAALAQPQIYPAKPVRLIVPLAAGGGADTFGRYLAKHLTDGLGQQVIVDNRPGGGGLIGGELVARAAPDGYTLLVGGSGQIVSSLTHRKLDVRKAYAAIAIAMEQPSLLVVHPSLPAANAAELIKLAKARPGVLNYASAGPGSTGHLAMEMFKMAARIDIVHVPYKGAGAALTDVISGQIPMLFSSPLGTMPSVRSGRLRALAVSSLRRMSGAPEIPTVSESGLPGFEATWFLGLLGPAGLPGDVVARLNAETGRIVQRRDVQEWLVQQGGEPASGTPEEFAARIRTSVEKVEKVVKEANLRFE